MPPPFCAGPAAPTWPWPPSWAPTCRSAWPGGGPWSAGSARRSRPLPYEDGAFTLLLLPFGVDTGAVYRAWDGLAARAGGTGAGVGRTSATNDLEAAALAGRAPPRERGGTGLEELTGRRPRLAGSGSTWFVEGSPEDLGSGTGNRFRSADEAAILVAVRTTPAAAPL